MRLLIKYPRHFYSNQALLSIASAFIVMSVVFLPVSFLRASQEQKEIKQMSTLETQIGSPAAAPIVCIDPGHPSEVAAGDVVQNGTTEVAVNWTIAKMLERELAEKHKIRTILTREKFEEKTLNRERAEIANRAGACLMVRLHCDTGDGSGITVYYPDRQGKKDGDVGPPAEVIEVSRKAAAIFDEAFKAVLAGALKVNGVKGDSATFIGGKQGALTGSIYSKVPVVTVEMVYLSNAEDARFIKSTRGCELVTEALARGVAGFVAGLPVVIDKIDLQE